jgi:adenosylcobinamide-GDP ribazoletransferase
LRVFLIGLQFLTRIAIVKQNNWTAEDFGKSVRFFPFIGVILGCIYAFLGYVMFFLFPQLHFFIPEHLRAVLLLVIPMLFTGGLHCDGFIDTMDGIFSGRSRERMLEIMKDSRVGANGVTAFIIFVLLEWSILIDLSRTYIIYALFVMPIIARCMMVMGIALFPYARPEGIGKAFADYADKKTLFIAVVTTLVFIAPCGVLAIVSLFITTIFVFCFARYVTRLLGGLTGDVYGALTELSELIVLIVFLVGNQFIR